MAIQSTDAERDKLFRENQKLRNIIPDVIKSLLIGGKGGSPGQPYDDPEKGKGPFVPPPGKGLTIAHGEGRGPQPKYHDEYNRELPIPPWMQMFPDGKVREIPWMKEEYENEHKDLLNISQSRRNKLIPMVMDKYGKRDGVYQDEDKLLRNLLTIAESTRV